MRRATEVLPFVPVVLAISIHALHEESDRVDGGVDVLLVISIHALHEESDATAAHLS